MTQHWWVHFVSVISIMLLSSCSDFGELGRYQADGVTIILATSPAPLQLGKGARVELSLSGVGSQVMSRCSVTIQRSMPGMEMDADAQRIPMRGQGDGAYRGQLGEFRMGGDWLFQVSLVCADKTFSARFDQNIPWPE